MIKDFVFVIVDPPVSVCYKFV